MKEKEDAKFKESERKGEMYCGLCREGMQIIEYVDFYGQKQEIEVSSDFYNKYKELMKEEKRIERKETRRSFSLDCMEDVGFCFDDKDQNPVNESEGRERVKLVKKMLDSLLPSQQKLVKQMVFEEKSMAEIARDEGVDSSAIRHRYRRAKERMKKWAENNGGKLLL